MNIVNLIHIGEEVLNFKDLSAEQKEEIAKKLNEQAFEAIGCRIKTA